jgi:hypothetical protein
LTGSPGFDWAGRVNPYLKKIQNGVVLVKKQKSTGCNRVFDRVLPGQPGRRVTPGHGLSYFFINPARFQPQAGPGFKTMLHSICSLNNYSKLITKLKQFD